MKSIEQVLKKLDINAHKHGDEWWACCPNRAHADTNPSWHIRDDRSQRHGLHVCKSCKFAGTLEMLVSYMTGTADPKKWLSSFRDEKPIVVHSVLTMQIAPIYRTMFRVPSEVIFDPLPKWVTPARRYVESRGITQAQVERWRLGYAVDGKLSGRIVIVKRNRQGQPAGYTARTFVDDAKRYLEARKAENADLGVFFGEEHWKGQPCVYVTEGSFNALAAERIRPHGAIAAASGSTFMVAHAEKLSRFPKVVLLMDPDVAGDTLAERYAQALMRHTHPIRVRLPEKQDAASLSAEELDRWLVQSGV